MRVGMRREHHEVMVVTAGLIEGRKRISMTTDFTHVGKVVAEMLGRFEFNFFSDRVGDRAAHRVPRPAEQDVLGPDDASGRIRLEPTDLLIAFGSADVVNWSSKVAFNSSYSEELWRK